MQPIQLIGLRLNLLEGFSRQLCASLFDPFLAYLSLWRYHRIQQNVLFSVLDVNLITLYALRMTKILSAVKHRWSGPVAVGVDCCPGKLPSLSDSLMLATKNPTKGVNHKLHHVLRDQVEAFLMWCSLWYEVQKHSLRFKSCCKTGIIF